VNEALPPAPLRRIVTGRNESGESTVVCDALLVPEAGPPGAPAVTFAWCTTETPPDVVSGAWMESVPMVSLGISPPAHGTHAGILDLPPRFDGMLHSTQTLDYVVVLDGEVELQLEAACITVGPGDIVVQRSTNHRWRNRTGEVARLLFVMLDATPLGTC
jgi:quercetin dioxygenase-like cupin family protein